MIIEQTIKVKRTKQELDDLDYALTILYLNRNSHNDPTADAQSRRAYELVKGMYKALGLPT